ncbi:hypothetical protein YA0788_23565 [Pseudomonas corrugata]|uniref:hypothetical protein n=1 Tax=Pseudomonas corrugata TaxID=47879 RepID=UPI0018E648FB|nr:hypothetical protein [Pseudomonas corrugata]MBI6695106.1 hypothetical protein [Pseudomonas corrugata]
MPEPEDNTPLINLESTNIQEIRTILSDHFINSSIDDESDLLIDGPGRIYLKVDREYGFLRFFCFVRLIKDWKTTEISTKLDIINKASFTIKYAAMTSSVMAEYGIPLSGHIDHKLLVNVIHHIQTEIAKLKIRLDDFVEG